jgi:hypothetical protein
MNLVQLSKSVGFKIGAGAVVLFAMATAQADLKQDMKQIGVLFKAINAQVSDATMDSDSASKADQLVALFTQAQSEIPDSVSALPADQQAAAESQFQAAIQKEIDSARALAAAFRAGDSGMIQTLLADMTATKKDGHSTFDPPTSP